MKCEAEGKILQELGRRVGKTRDGREWESIDYLLQEDNDIYHYHLRFTMTSFDGPVIDAPAWATACASGSQSGLPSGKASG